MVDKKIVLGKEFIEESAESNEEIKALIIRIYDSRKIIGINRNALYQDTVKLSEAWGTSYDHTKRAMDRYMYEHGWNWK